MEESLSRPNIGENAEPLEVRRRDDGGGVRSEGRPRGGVTSRRMRTREVGVRVRSLSELKPSEPTEGKRSGEELRIKEGSRKGLVLELLPVSSDRVVSVIVPKLCDVGLPKLPGEGGNLSGDTFRVESIIVPNGGSVAEPGAGPKSIGPGPTWGLNPGWGNIAFR